MPRTRLASLGAATLCLALFAAGVASADGLDRFKKSIEPLIPPNTLAYKNAKALGDSGFQLDDVVVTPPPSDPNKKSDPIKIKTVTVETLDFDAIEKQQPPLFAKIKFDGVTSGPNAGGVDLKQTAGIDSLSADFGVDYKLEPDKKIFTLKRMELNLNGLGKVQMSFMVDGVDMAAASQPEAAMNNASLKSANLIYDDHSLLSIAIPIAAAMQGSDPKAMTAMAIGFLDAMRAGQSEATQKSIDLLVAYVEDYQKPKGPLKITLNPPGPVSNAALSNAKSAVNNFNVMREMGKRNLDIRLSPISNILRMRKVKAGTQITIGVAGDVITPITSGEMVGALILCDKKQFDRVKAELEREMDNAQANTDQRG